MQIEHLIQRLERLSRERQLKFSVGDGASVEEIAHTEHRLGLKFPEQVKLFYRSLNGLVVEEPSLRIVELKGLEFVSPAMLHFARFDGRHRMFFNVSGINDAGQWDILAEDGYRITMTMASFWSNKIWAWIENGRAVWKGDPDFRDECEIGQV